MDAIVTWFLDVVSRHSTSWLGAITAGGMAGDADVDRVIAEAVDVAADRVLTAVGPPRAQPGRCTRWPAPTWASPPRPPGSGSQRGELTRAQVHKLLAATLLAMVDQVFPDA